MEIRPVTRKLLALILCALAAPAQAAQKLELKTLVDVANTEIYSPVFVPGTGAVVCVKKKHEPDFHEAEAFSESELAVIRARSKSDARWADPEITLLSGDGSPATVVDFGWNPEVSAKGDRLYYVHQKAAISGKRVLAETQRGNEIYEYVFSSKKVREVAAPAEGYLDMPIAHPSEDKVAFALCDAINGAYGGPVGVGVFDAGANATRIALAPAKHFELFDLIGAPLWAGSNLMATRRTPCGTGTFLADSYKFDVLNLQGSAPKVVYARKEPVELTGGGVHLDYSGDKLKIRETSRITEITPEDGRIVSETPVSPAESQSERLLSPDESLELSVQKSKVVIKDTRTGKKLYAPVQGQLASALWSRDSTRLLLVLSVNRSKSGEEVFDRDRLVEILVK